MKIFNLCTILGIWALTLQASETAHPGLEISEKGKESVVLATKRISIDGYPKANNPSMIRTNDGILMIFRNIPNPDKRPFVSETGALWLNEALEPISAPQLLITRKIGDITPQQSEDARLFLWDNQVYIVYNDNVDVVNPSEWDRRDIFIAKLNYTNGRFQLDAPIKLVHETDYEKIKWQKNWLPFDWEGSLFLGYSINPQEILTPNLETGVCSSDFKTKGDMKWHWGKLRGGTPPQLQGDHYLAFFHSPLPFVSETTQGRQLMHYFMGAYTFSAEPPFQVTSISPYPIAAEGFYTASPLGIRCVYPGGFITDSSYIYVCYGKDDHEVWVAILDKEKLYSSLVPVHETEEASSHSLGF